MSKLSWELYYYTLKLSEKVLFSREYCINTGNIQIDWWSNKTGDSRNKSTYVLLVFKNDKAAILSQWKKDGWFNTWILN